MAALSTGLKTAVILCSTFALGGCLVSDEPMLNAANGAATPLAPGAYKMCPSSNDGEEGRCEVMTVTYNDAGLYLFQADGEPAQLRFRKIGRDGYAVQSREDDGAYSYFYGAGKSERFRLTMMLCAGLPDRLRARLAAKGDLESNDDEFQTCKVNTLRGLTKAAKAYHRGKVVSDDDIVLELVKTSAETKTPETE